MHRSRIRRTTKFKRRILSSSPNCTKIRVLLNEDRSCRNARTFRWDRLPILAWQTIKRKGEKRKKKEKQETGRKQQGGGGGGGGARLLWKPGHFLVGLAREAVPRSENVEQYLRSSVRKEQTREATSILTSDFGPRRRRRRRRRGAR